MKKKKSLTYNSLINVYKEVILSITMEKHERVKTQRHYLADHYSLLDKYKHIDTTLEINGLTSRLWRFGGTTPKNLLILLKYEHLLKVCKQWLNFLFPYYKLFIPELTKKKMWELIVEARKEWEQIKRDKYDKIYIREQNKRYFESLLKEEFGNNISTGIRLWPLDYKGNYITFKKKIVGERRAVLLRRQFDIDIHLFPYPNYKKLYIHNGLFAEFSICDGKIILY